MAAENLTHLYDFSHDPVQRVKAVEAEAMLADARPKDFFWNSSATIDYIAITPDPVRAATYLRRSLELITPEIRENFPIPVSYLELVPFTESWVKGELPAAAAELDKVAEKIDSLGGRGRDCLAAHAALGYLTLGRLETAARISEKIGDPLDRDVMLAQVDFLRGDDLPFRRDLRASIGRRSNRVTDEVPETALILEARAGLLSGREANLIQRELDGSPKTLHAMRGEFALAHGHPGAAIRELDEYLKGVGEGPYLPSLYLISESLAAALAAEGDLARAIHVLEQNADKRAAAVAGGGGGTTAAYWLRNRLDLARLYRRAGRVEDARAVEADLSKLLSLADPDHPILRELARLRSS